MKNRTILLLGGSGDIGTAIYDKLKDDFDIVLPSSKDLDLSNLESVRSFLSVHPMSYDFIVYAPGINIKKSIEDVSEFDLDIAIKINLIGLFLLCKNNIGYWKENRFGSIISIGSLFSTSAKADRLPYIVSKHGLYGLVKSLAIELAKYNILVNLISPGYIRTKLTLTNNSKEEISIIENSIPLMRIGNPNEIAHLVNFFVRDNTYITGQNIIIDGGISIDYSK